MAQLVGGFGIVRVKVWNPQGIVVYSDDRSLIGQKFTLSDELQDALRGEVAREISPLEKVENRSERSYGKLLEVYVPVIPPGSADVLGAHEIYQSFAPLQAKITNIRKSIWGGSVLVFSLLFVSLFALMRGASLQLTHMAYHDPLTGLANRRLLRDRAERALSVARRYGRARPRRYRDRVNMLNLPIA